MVRVATVARAGVAAATTDGAGAVERLGRTWQLLRRGAVDGELGGRLGRSGEPGHVDPVQLDVLDLLVRHDGQRMSDLAIATRVDPSTITRAMHRMEAAGLATRRAVAADGRVVTAHLTDAGRDLHRLVSQRRAELIRAAIADFTPEEQERLADLLERFVGSLVAAAGADATGPQPTAAG
jgi:DNA-binding MarR family transcriptional regulator